MMQNSPVVVYRLPEWSALGTSSSRDAESHLSLLPQFFDDADLFLVLCLSNRTKLATRVLSALVQTGKGVICVTPAAGCEMCHRAYIGSTCH